MHNLTATTDQPSTATTDAPTPKYRTREQWLRGGLFRLTRLFRERGYTVPRVAVSVGWPGGTRKVDTVIGQCWSPLAAADARSQVYVSPVVDNPFTALEILVHEMIHAIMYADGTPAGHGRTYWAIAQSVNLEPDSVRRGGKVGRTMESTHAGADLTATLLGIMEELGTYPHGALTREGLATRPKQSTRMLKVQCLEPVEEDEGGEAGYTVRTTAKWLGLYGAPICPCHEVQMAVITEH